MYALLRRVLFALSVFAVMLGIWLCSLRVFYRPSVGSLRPTDGSVSLRAHKLLSRQMALWSQASLRAQETTRMRRSNPEWDFMGRTYLVLALANIALRQPTETARYLSVIDRIIDDTLTHERVDGTSYFLMAYAHNGTWVNAEQRSVFVDGEIAMMIAARRFVRDDRAELVTMLRDRALQITTQMHAGPIGSAESYPNECWTFCNTVALAALRMHDALDATNHDSLRREWLAQARAHLVDRRSGLLVSSYTMQGETRDGPEGSSIYMVAHDLLLIDRNFAREQYALAHQHLNREWLGFGFALEWPMGGGGGGGRVDIDSGPTVPLVGANAGASGMALLGAGAFNDNCTLAGLVGSLELAAFPREDASGLRYNASNGVGDAVLLYALVQGPLWQAVEQRGGVR